MPVASCCPYAARASAIRTGRSSNRATDSQHEAARSPPLPTATLADVTAAEQNLLVAHLRGRRNAGDHPEHYDAARWGVADSARRAHASRGFPARPGAAPPVRE